MNKPKPTEIANISQVNSSAIVQMDPLTAMIERAARDPGIDLERLERLMQMKERGELKQAEADFNDAMAAAQGEMSAVAADASNPQTKSKYASYFALDKAIRPIYRKHELSLSFNTDEATAADHIRIVCYVSRKGYTRTYHVDMPADGKGAKGGDVMTKTHAAGAAMSYGQRYLLKLIFNIAVGDDRDGNKSDASPKVTNEQCIEIENLLDDDVEKIAALKKYLGLESLMDMTVAVYERAKRSIEHKKKMSAAAKEQGIDL